MNIVPLLAVAALAATPAAEAPVRATLDAWLAAQNQGNFAAYASLYASKFSGVKRSGPRIRRMDRAAWLKDRQAMFRKKMTVGMSNVVVAMAGGAANVSFVQRWASGKYQDEGPKRMLLVPEGGQLRIAQEEMLASNVDGEYQAVPQAMLMLNDTIVLTTKVDKAWGVGPATIEGYQGRRAVDEARLPESFRGLAGKPVEVFDKDGQRCTAKLAGFELQALAEWHFGTLEEWKTAPKATIAAEVWAQGQPLLAGRLKDKRGKCGQLVFARVQGSSSAPVIPFREVSGALASQAKAQAAALVKDKAAEVTSAETLPFQLAQHPTVPAQSLLFLSVEPEPCTPEASLSLEVIWRVDLGSKPVSFTPLLSGDAQGRTALLAVDLDGDGQLELIYQGWPREKVGIMRFDKAGKMERLFVEIPYYDCPC